MIEKKTIFSPKVDDSAIF